MFCPWATGGTRTFRHSSPPTWRPGCRRLPKVKLLGYYSDAYKLEFILPKFNMYRRILAKTLAEECVRGRGWPVDRALQAGKVILLDNPRRVFGRIESAPRRRFDLRGNERHVLGYGARVHRARESVKNPV